MTYLGRQILPWAFLLGQVMVVGFGNETSHEIKAHFKMNNEITTKLHYRLKAKPNRTKRLGMDFPNILS